jgi:hypothetical protein
MNRDAPPPYREEDLRHALAEDDRVHEMELSVTIVDDRVVVSGTVPTEERRSAVTEVTRELVPDLEVDNQVSVLHPSTPHEESPG